MGSGRGPLAVAPAAPVVRAPRGARAVGTLAIGDEIADTATGDRYVIRSLIGEGGMGRVFRVERLSDGAAFAVKCNQPIDPRNRELATRMMREGDFLKALRPHPHIVPVLATGMREDGVFWILMPILDGASLGGLMAVLGRLPPVWVFEIASAVCNALATVHEVGIHRDIKPENVFLTREGGIYVLDFGAGKSYVVGRLTSTGTAIGTVPYMSPEQLSGTTDIEGHSDLFSLGVVIYQMLCGEHPFDGDGPLRGNNILIGQRILTEPPRPLAAFAPELPGYVGQVVEKLLAKRPHDRARTSAEAFTVLRAARDALAHKLGEPPPIARLFDRYDEALRAQGDEEAARRATEKAPPLDPSGPRPKLGTVPVELFQAPGSAPPAQGTTPLGVVRPITEVAAIEDGALRGGTLRLDGAMIDAIHAAPLPAPAPLTETNDAPLPAPLVEVDEAPRSAPGSVHVPDEDEIAKKLAAIDRLATDDTDETREALLVTLTDAENHPVVRAAAAVALVSIGDETCLETLQDAAATDADTMVRRMSEEAAVELSLRLGLPIHLGARPVSTEPAPPSQPSALSSHAPVPKAGSHRAKTALALGAPPAPAAVLARIATPRMLPPVSLPPRAVVAPQQVTAPQGGVVVRPPARVTGGASLVPSPATPTVSPVLAALIVLAVFLAAGALVAVYLLLR